MPRRILLFLSDFFWIGETDTINETNTLEEINEMAASSEKPVVTPRVIHSTVAGIQLNDEQRSAIKNAAGVDVEWLLFTQSKDHLARALDGNALSVTRVTWCW